MVWARDTEARELMDAPDADLAALHRTYARFAPLNRLVSGWRALYRRQLRHRGAELRVLDVGCGGADVARALLRWSRRDGLHWSVLGIDPDARAIEWARARPEPGLSLRAAHSAELDEPFDLIISNHVLHHLSPSELTTLLADSERLLAPGGLALHSDLERSRVAFAVFGAVTWPLQDGPLRGSFIRPDGLTSIRRAYTAAELRSITPPDWRVDRAAPARLHLRFEKPGNLRVELAGRVGAQHRIETSPRTPPAPA